MRTILRDNYTPELGDYHERILIDNPQEKMWLFDCDGVFTDITRVIVDNEFGNSTKHAISQAFFTDTVQGLKEAMEEGFARIDGEIIRIDGRIDDLDDTLHEEIARVDQEIEDLRNSPDVVDIVPTYAALQTYDTTTLGDKDVVRVLADETHQGTSSYYRWNKAQGTWTYIGATGPYYTKSETDALLATKQDVLTAGDNITIENNVISALNPDTVDQADWEDLFEDEPSYGTVLYFSESSVSGDIWPDGCTVTDTDWGKFVQFVVENDVATYQDDLRSYSFSFDIGTREWLWWDTNYDEHRIPENSFGDVTGISAVITPGADWASLTLQTSFSVAPPLIEKPLQKEELESMYGKHTYAYLDGKYVDNSVIKKITIAPSPCLTRGYSIENDFLWGAQSIGGVVFGENVKSIGDRFLLSADVSDYFEIIIPDNIEEIGESFLSGSSFYGSVTIGRGITEIKDYFMSSISRSFTLSLPDTITKIGSFFLRSCYYYNSPLVLDNVVEVGDYFLAGNNTFNQEVSLPNAKEIGTSFLATCGNFNRALTIPGTVHAIGSRFMYNAFAFTGPLTVNTAVSPTDNSSLASSSASSAIYSVGVLVNGTGSSSWASALPNRNSNPYRKLRIT